MAHGGGTPSGWPGPGSPFPPVGGPGDPGYGGSGYGDPGYGWSGYGDPRYGGPGYGGQGQGGFPPPFPPPRRNSGLVIVIIAAALLVIGGVTAFVLTRTDNGKPQPGALRSASSSPAAPAPGGPGGPSLPSPPASGPPTPASTFRSTVPGWQVVVASQSNGLSYDVPPAWKNNGRGVTIGLDDGSAFPKTVVSFTAEAKRGACFLGGAGFSSSKVNGIDAAARQGASMWVRSAEYKSTSPHSTIGGVRRVHLKGLTQAAQITARVTTGPQADNCGSRGTVIHIVALPVRSGGSLLFVLWTHGGQAGAVGESDASKIVNSVRLAK